MKNKRLFAALLIAVVAVCLLPAAAQAEENETYGTLVIDAVAKGDRQYLTGDELTVHVSDGTSDVYTVTMKCDEDFKWTDNQIRLAPGKWVVYLESVDAAIPGCDADSSVSVDRGEYVPGLSAEVTVEDQKTTVVAFLNTYTKAYGALELSISAIGLDAGVFPSGVTVDAASDDQALINSIETNGTDVLGVKPIKVTADIMVGKYDVSVRGGEVDGYAMTAVFSCGESFTIARNETTAVSVVLSYVKKTTLNTTHKYYLDTVTDGVTVRTLEHSARNSYDGLLVGDEITVADYCRPNSGASAYTFESSTPGAGSFTLGRENNELVINYVRTVSVTTGWSAPVYTWSDDHSTCTAMSTFLNDRSRTQKETVSSTRRVVTAATASSDGKGEFVAVFTNPAFTEQTVSYTIPATSDGAAQTPAPTDRVTQTPASPDSAPATGDGSHTALWAVVAALSGAAVLTVRRRRTN